MITDWEIKHSKTGKTFINGWDDRSYAPIVSGILEPFPGSETWMVSHSLNVRADMRHMGIGYEYNKKLLQVAAWRNATAIVASVKPSNTNQKDRLLKLGWKRISNSLWMVKVPKEFCS